MVRLKDFHDCNVWRNVLFQFLMVRLKGIKEHSISVTITISIPYGSIKSRSAQRAVACGGAFQFLMVRLKGI